MLVSEFNAIVVTVYEPSKKTLAAELKETFGKKLILIEDRPISLVAGLLSYCRFIVTHNTDLFQLAVALKLPTLGILTRAERIQWSPPDHSDLTHLERPNNSWPSNSQFVTAVKTLIKTIRQQN